MNLIFKTTDGIQVSDFYYFSEQHGDAVLLLIYAAVDLLWSNHELDSTWACLNDLIWTHHAIGDMVDVNAFDYLRSVDDLERFRSVLREALSSLMKLNAPSFNDVCVKSYGDFWYFNCRGGRIDGHLGEFSIAQVKRLTDYGYDDLNYNGSFAFDKAMALRAFDEFELKYSQIGALIKSGV